MLDAMDPLTDRWQHFLAAEPQYLDQFLRHTHGTADGSVEIHDGSPTAVCFRCMPVDENLVVRLVAHYPALEAEVGALRRMHFDRAIVDAIMAEVEEDRDIEVSDAADSHGQPLKVGDKVRLVSRERIAFLCSGRDGDRLPAEVGTVEKVDFVLGTQQKVLANVQWPTAHGYVGTTEEPCDLRVVESAPGGPPPTRREALIQRRQDMNLTPDETAALLDRVARLHPDEFAAHLDRIAKERAARMSVIAATAHRLCVSTPLPHTAEALVGRTVRLARNGRRQRVRVDRVEDIGNGWVVVSGDLLYRADNHAYAGSSRGRFNTMLRPDDVVEECE